MKYWIVLGCMLFWGSGPSLSNSTRYVSNFDFLKKTACETFRELFQSIELNREAKFKIKNHQADNEQAWFVDGCIFETLKGLGAIDIYIDSGESEVEGGEHVFNIFYHIIELSLDLQPTSGWSFREVKTLNRTAKAHFHVQISAGNYGKLIWNQAIKREDHDQIPTRVAKESQSTAMPVTIAMAPSTSLIKRFIEPVVVVGISGAIIYSFYALRSK